MTEIRVAASKAYTVTVGRGLLEQIGSILLGTQTVCIVSDQTVWKLFGEKVQYSCLQAGCQVCHFILAPGENSKNFENYLSLLNFLAENHLTRSDRIIALGGGVIGDLAGFAAATYLRGIGYIQVPTTLLAMVDSSVGGKTAIDLPAGKNLCGAFYQPEAVLCDLDTLDTLPPDVFRDGCAEVIKYAVLFDPELFSQLEQMGLDFDQEAVVTRCICHKRDVVAGDEFDLGNRNLLNLGHTVGHAIERCSNYTITHGSAVAIGIAVVSLATKCSDANRIVALLNAFDLPTTTSLPAQALWETALSDKKRSAYTLKLIVPNAIGECRIVHTDIHDLKTLIEEGLSDEHHITAGSLGR